MPEIPRACSKYTAGEIRNLIFVLSADATYALQRALQPGHPAAVNADVPIRMSAIVLRFYTESSNGQLRRKRPNFQNRTSSHCMSE